MNFLNYCVKHEKCVILSGTELIQNLLIPKYKKYDETYNYIAPKSAYNFKQNIGMKQNINYSIIHFKGRINHWQNTKYLDTFKKLTNTQ